MHGTPHPTRHHDDLPSLAELREIDALAREVAAELGVKLKERDTGTIVYLDPFHHSGIATFWLEYRRLEVVSCPYRRLKERATWVAMLTPWAGTATNTG